MRDCFQTVIGHVWTSTLMKLYHSTISLSLFYNFFAFFSMAFLVKEGSLLWKVWLLSTSSVVAGSDATETHPGLEHDFIFLRGTTAIQLSSLMITINISSLLLIIRFQGGPFL